MQPNLHQPQDAVIIAALAQLPGSQPLRVILAQSGLEMAPRTFSHLLDRLVQQGLIVREGGRTKAARYRIANGPGGPTVLPTPTPVVGKTIFSQKSEQILSILGRPTTEREPISYDRRHLNKYIPNETYYLSEFVRRHLGALGQTPDEKMAAGTYAKEILQHLLVDLSWNSSRLEGNTYSLLDTKRLIEEGVEATGKKAEEAQIILNHKEAIRFLVEDVDSIAIDSMTVRNLHALLSFNLLHDPADRGQIRRKEVYIHGSVYIPLQIPLLINECFNQILKMAQAITDPFEQSLFILVHLPYLKPFHDVNKRTARLASNIPLIIHKLRPLSFDDVARETYTSAHLAMYELGRVELLRDVFVFAYERSCKRYEAVRSSLGEPDPFRQKYRALMKQIVRTAVKASNTEEEAIMAIESAMIMELPLEDRSRFLAMAEAGLKSMHDGNFSEFGLRPSEFRSWQTRTKGAGSP